MITYTKKNVNILAFVITALIFIFLHILNFIFFTNNQKVFSSNLVYSKVIPNYSSSLKDFNTSTNKSNYLNNQSVNMQNSNIYNNEIIKNIGKTKKATLIIKETDNSNNLNVNSEKEVKTAEVEKQSQEIVAKKAKNETETEIATQEKSQTDETSKTQRQYIQENKQTKWRIQIPKLNLDVHIQEGTTSEILLTSVGHFEETSKWKGNVGLAAHNRGYNCNFFQEIKTLNEGDEIIYTTTNGKKVYRVETNKVISETDWSYLQKTEDNRITLITCEENRKEYRRCVQAVEVANYIK